jgi:hypothetical protein
VLHSTPPPGCIIYYRRLEVLAGRFRVEEGRIISGNIGTGVLDGLGKSDGDLKNACPDIVPILFRGSQS